MGVICETVISETVRQAHSRGKLRSPRVERTPEGRFLQPSNVSAAGARALNESLTSEQRTASARKAANSRWSKHTKTKGGAN